MCKMDQNTFVLRGISHTAPYTHVVRKYRKDGVLLHSWLSRCDHDWSIGIQSILIGVTNFIVESCPKCQEIRLYTKEEGFKSVAFANKAFSPGKMCTGPKGSLFVYDRKNSNVLRRPLADPGGAPGARPPLKDPILSF